MTGRGEQAAVAMDLARIEDEDARLQALVPEPDRAARIARELAAAPAGPLRGVPVGVKDIMHVDGLATGAGSHLPPAELAGPEATAVSLLRAAGAVVLAKTVTTEFALFAPGPTRNPHNPAHSPGGSSSGSAAAVAASFCPLALGTQTCGSVIRPAAYCGVVGFKPSYGRISTGGVLLVAESFDTLGLFAADLAWVERAAPVLCSWWRPVGPLGPPVLARPDGPYLDQASAEGRAVLNGLDAAPVPFFADIERINAAHHRLMRFELARNHARWYPRLAECYHPSTVTAIRDGLTVDPAEAARIRRGRLELRARIHAAMDAAGIDLWVCPAASGPAPAGLASTGDPHLQLPWTHAGLPAVTLPWTTAAGGLPLGLQLVGRFMDDERLLAWAAQLVRRTAAVRA